MSFAGLAKSKDDRPTGSVNYGRLSLTSRYIIWKDNARVELTEAEFDAAPPGDRRIEITVALDTQAINPGGFTYFAKRIDAWQQDFNKIWLPSLKAVFGDKAVEDDIEGVMARLPGMWVAIEDVPQIPKRGESPEQVKYRTPKLVAVYQSQEECLAAYVAQYGQPQARDGAGAVATDPVAAMCPAGYNAEEWGQAVTYARSRMSEPGYNALKLAQELGLPADVAAQLFNLLLTPAELLPF